MIYQFNPDMLPDESFLPGELKYVVPGNHGRLLDQRRTPLRIVEVNNRTGVFVVEILDFEDKGGRWELTLEGVDRCQFARESSTATDAEVARCAVLVSHFNRLVQVDADAHARELSEARIAALQADVRTWLARESELLRSRVDVDLEAETGNETLRSDLERYMTAKDLWDVETAFADEYVRNYYYGESVKAHGIVFAELGLVSYNGKQLRDPEIFDGAMSRQRRGEHILHRLAFVRELFSVLNRSVVVLYRGWSSEGEPKEASRSVRAASTFVSASFRKEVAMSHFNHRNGATSGSLFRQPVPVERVFMTFLETAHMNGRFKESEAVLLRDDSNPLF